MSSFEAVQLGRQQAIDHAFGVRSTIDVIADVNDDARARTRSTVFNDQLMDRIEQVEASMNIAHGINAHVRGQRRGWPLLGRNISTKQISQSHCLYRSRFRNG